MVEGSISGPILFTKDDEGNKVSPLLGLFLSGNYTYQQDPPRLAAYNYARRGARADFGQPLAPEHQFLEVNGALYNADFLTANDFERIPRASTQPTRTPASWPNRREHQRNDSLTFGATGYYSQGSYSYANSLMNWENNLDVTGFDWRAYAKFAQRFVESEDDADASTLKNVFYQVMADYSQSFQRVQDLSHGDNFFRYGHVGTFDVYKRNSYGYDPAGARFVHNGWEDTLVTFTPSPYNPELAAINNQYFSLFDYEPYNAAENGPYESLLTVQNGNALLNGQGPPGTYGLWSYYGAQGNSYSINNTQPASAQQVQLGDHALQMGFEYEQRRDAFFARADRAVDHRSFDHQLAHQELNLNDSTITNQGSAFYVTYGCLTGQPVCV